MERIIERPDGEFLMIWNDFGSGDYHNELELVPERKTLLEEGQFIKAVAATLEKWPAVTLPAVFRPFEETMRAVRLGGRYTSHAATVPILLCFKSIIRLTPKGPVVMMPISTFVIGALTHLAEDPHLRVDDWDWDFRESLRKQWERITGAAIPVPA